MTSFVKPSPEASQTRWRLNKTVKRKSTTVRFFNRRRRSARCRRHDYGRRRRHDSSPPHRLDFRQAERPNGHGRGKRNLEAIISKLSTALRTLTLYSPRSRPAWIFLNVCAESRATRLKTIQDVFCALWGGWLEILRPSSLNSAGNRPRACVRLAHSSGGANRPSVRPSSSENSAPVESSYESLQTFASPGFVTFHPATERGVYPGPANTRIQSPPRLPPQIRLGGLY